MKDYFIKVETIANKQKSYEVNSHYVSRPFLTIEMRGGLHVPQLFTNVPNLEGFIWLSLCMFVQYQKLPPNYYLSIFLGN